MTDVYRILAIHVCSRGMSFVVFEDGHRLVERGRFDFDKRQTVERMLGKAQSLIGQYAPEVLVLRPLRRNQYPHSKTAIFHRGAISLAARTGVLVHLLKPDEIARTFTVGDLQPNRSRIFRQIAARYSELAVYLPVSSRPWWQQEAPNLMIFDAMAMAMAYSASQRTTRH